MLLSITNNWPSDFSGGVKPPSGFTPLKPPWLHTPGLVGVQALFTLRINKDPY